MAGISRARERQAETMIALRHGWAMRWRDAICEDTVGRPDCLVLGALLAGGRNGLAASYVCAVLATADFSAVEVDSSLRRLRRLGIVA